MAKRLRSAGLIVAMLLVSACASHDAERKSATPAPAASQPDLAAAALGEDKQKGRCNRLQYDYDGSYTSVRACAEGDLTAGSCDWHGENIAIFECQYQSGDRDYVGAFVLALHDVSDGRITSLDFVRGATVQVSAEFKTVAEWRRWQLRDEDETLTRALILWGRIYRRNHRVQANPCVQISNAALSSRSQLAAWGAIADGSYAILSRRCEGD